MVTTTAPRWKKAQLDEPVGSPSTAAMLMAETEGKMAQGTEEIKIQAGEAPEGYQGGTITHRRPVSVWMWKPTPYGWRPRKIKATNLRHALEDGWLAYCGDCRSQTCGVPGGTDVNACPGREALKFRRCPECGKRVFDAPSVRAVDMGDGDENEIQDEDLQPSTPEQRTRARLEIHMSAFHPQEAANYGIRVALDAHPSAIPQPKGAA